MPRIDIELTSARADGTWTWRAAGARQPKGVLEGAVLYEGAKVGDVLKAEADFDLDGINVTSVVPPKAKKAGPETLPLLGSGKEEALVTHSPLKPEREGGERGGRRDRGDRFGGGGFGGPGGPGGGRGGPGGRGERGPVGPDGRPLGPGATRPRATPGPAAVGPRDGARREGRGPGGPGSTRERPRPDRPERPRSERPAGGPPRDGERRERPPREGAGRERASRPPSTPPPARPRPPAKRLSPGRAHRDALLAGLAPEQRAIAEQVMRGGMAGVRAAVDEQNKQARAAGGPEIKADAILSLAEELLRTIQAAEWRDKAEAAASIVDEISLRDLRTVVAGADAGGRDEESRALAARLREGLERRSAAERQTWIDEITTCLTEGRVVRALRVSSRAPEQGLRLPPELSSGLSTAAGEAMAADTAPDRWLAVLEAALTSPVRRSLTPKALPSGADEATLKTVRAAMSKVPALGPLLGETPSSRPVPPPPPRRPPAPPAAAAPAPTPAEAASEPEPQPGPEPAPAAEAAAAPEPAPATAESQPPTDAIAEATVTTAGAASAPAEPAPADTAPPAEADPPADAADAEPVAEAAQAEVEPKTETPAPEPPLLMPPEPPPAAGAEPPFLPSTDPPPPIGVPQAEPPAADPAGDDPPA